MTQPTIVNTIEMLKGLTPMLASTCEEDLKTLVGTHVFDQKLDGVRAIIAKQNGEVSIRNRSGRDITEVYPDVEAVAFLDLPDGVVVDGEIVSDKGFEAINKRDRQKKDWAAAAVDVPARFVAFDILHDPAQGDVRHWSYEMRRRLLEATVPQTSRLAVSICSPDPDLYEQIKNLGGEGVVAKRIAAPYGKGRKKDWLKYKATRRVSCIAVKYEPGNGSRKDIGALLLAMVNDEGAGQYVGKVGSGMKREDLDELKALIDADVCPVIEVEVLGRTTNDLLRQPVFISIRSDLPAHAVRVNQLNALPKG